MPVTPTISSQKLNTECSFSGSVFFYISQEKAFEHLAIPIAEGLKALGIPFYANLNYWKNKQQLGGYLFNHESS
ncbi:MAG: hypothetical protein F6K17_41960, partial [Okeania sp. SIO3C4]|nr:hypothetical protein [Okeania sp. SIO3C4]